MDTPLSSTDALTDCLTVTPGAALHGAVGAGNLRLPGDKSLSHRAALLAAMAEGTSQVENFLVSGVTQAMLEALTALGVSWQLDGRTLTVQGVGLTTADGRPPVRSGVTLNCGNSATTLRLLAGALAAWGVEATLDGSPGLRRRPMNRILQPLEQMGVAAQSENGCAPLTLRPGERPLRALTYELPVASAQVKSCLLLAALAAEGETVLSEPGPSRDHTERMLAALGAAVEKEEPHPRPFSCSEEPHLRPFVSGEEPHPQPLSRLHRTQPGEGGQPRVRDEGGAKVRLVTRLRPPAPRRLAPLRVTLPGDMSAAAFLIVAALITPGSEITVHGVGLNPTRTGLLDTLLEMGAEIEISGRSEQGGEPVGDLRVRSSRLHAVTVGGERVVRMIDEFPVFAVAAACADGRTVVRDAEELRHKESDRISALGGELLRLGVAFEETPDGFAITGGKPVLGGVVQVHGDHRLAMALLVAGLAAQSPVTVAGAGMMNESFPDFAGVLRGLGGQVA